jgi:hypothetical protein
MGSSLSSLISSKLIGDCGTLDLGVGVEHHALTGCKCGSLTLVVASVLYWELERYEVESCPALKEVICD